MHTRCLRARQQGPQSRGELDDGVWGQGPPEETKEASANNLPGAELSGSLASLPFVAQEATGPEKAKPGLEVSLKEWGEGGGQKAAPASWVPAPKARGGKGREEGGEGGEADGNTVFETTGNTWTTQTEAWNCETLKPAWPRG